MEGFTIARYSKNSGGEDSRSSGPEKTVISLFIDDDNEDEDYLEPGRSKGLKNAMKANAELFALLSVIYGIWLVVFGIIFPISEALNELWLKTIAYAIFLVFLYTVATVYLIYLQVYIVPASRKKHHLAEERRKEKIMDNLKAFEAKRRKSMAVASYTEAEVIPPSSPMSRYSPAAKFFPRRGSIAFDQSEKVETLSWVEDDKKAVESAWMNLEELDEMFGGEGSSFYLRMGILIFSLANMIYVGLELEYYFGHTDPSCDNTLYGWTFLFRLFFLIVQTFFLLKNAQAHVGVHKTIARFGFMHLIATNICVWFQTLVNEIYYHNQHHSDTGNTTESAPHSNMDSGNVNFATSPDTCHNLLDSASAYLFPFVMEFSLIAVGILFVMFIDVDKKEVSSFLRSLKHILKHQNKDKDKTKSKSKDKKSRSHDEAAHSDESSDVDIMEHISGPMHASNHLEGIQLDKSHKGMFLAVLLLAAIFVVIILFFSEMNSGNTDSAQTMFYVIDISTVSFIICANIAVAYGLNKLPLMFKPSTVDDTILLIAMSGASFLYVAIIVAEVSLLSKSDHLSDTETMFAVLSLTTSILGIIMVLLQTVVVIGAMRKFTIAKHGLQDIMPGREAVTFLIVTNVSVWIYKSMLFKDIDMTACSAFYGENVWVIISNINLPLLLFYHFHSSAIYAEVWSSAYKPVKIDIAKAALENTTTLTADDVSTSTDEEHHNTAFVEEDEMNQM